MIEFFMAVVIIYLGVHNIMNRNGVSELKKLRRDYKDLQNDYDFYYEAAQLYYNKHDKLLDEWNSLARQIKKHGGWQHMKACASGNKTVSGFTQDEINKLVILCHPDKHNGKQMAQDLTKKLIAMRS